MKPVSRELALELVWRHEDAGTVGDPACEDCRGDGSVEVDEDGEGRGFKRCSCQDRLDEAYELAEHSDRVIKRAIESFK